MLFQDAILEFGFDCKVRKLSPKSINNYQKQLRYLQNYLEQEYRIKNVHVERHAHSFTPRHSLDRGAIIPVGI